VVAVSLAPTLINLAVLERHQNNHAQALTNCDRAIAILQPVVTATHPLLAAALRMTLALRTNNPT
jgi:hypothetical protein